jgi:hypothetical protein
MRLENVANSLLSRNKRRGKEENWSSLTNNNRMKEIKIKRKSGKLKGVRKREEQEEHEGENKSEKYKIYKLVYCINSKGSRRGSTWPRGYTPC